MSEQVIHQAARLGLAERQANLLGVAVEETAVAIAENTAAGRQAPLIDVLFSRDGDERLVIFRSNGVPYNPLAQSDDEPASGIAMLKHIVKSAEYARQLGFNTVVLKF